MSGDHIYSALSEEHGGDTRWAFGTGFTDALAGVDTTLPEGVDGQDLALYCQMLGDDALVQAQRLITGSPTHPSWRRRSRWPTSPWTCSARPACCWPAPDRPTAPDATRTTSPTGAAPPSSATSA